MNSLTSRQRKLVYLIAMGVLFIPIVFLGMPSARVPAGQEESAGAAGGYLARLRTEHELGETTLGNVDPTSATMNLVLLGMRGVAASHLWHQAIEHQKNKDWAEVRAVTESIILLQPHFIKVWNFQGWNLAYNISAEWDKIDDRYYWVKEGIKFTMRGVEQNRQHPELYWYVGNMFGTKIRRSDEALQFRKYFVGAPGYPDPEPDPEDPEPDIRRRRKKYKQGYDTDLNRHGEDNYLVARNWFLDANAKEKDAPDLQHIMANVLFRTFPVRALTDYAMAFQREGVFDEVGRTAWLKSYDAWINEYGNEEFQTDAGSVRMEVPEEELRQWEAEEVGITDHFKMRTWWKVQYDKMANYTYWRRRCRLEGERNVDHLIPASVETGDKFTITLDGETIAHTAVSNDPGEVVRGLAKAWGTSTKPAFNAIQVEVSEEKQPDGAPQPLLKLTWTSSPTHQDPVLAAANGGAKDDQKFDRKVHTRAIVDAHRALYEGERLHFAGSFVEAEKTLSSGLQKFEQTLRQYPDFLHDDDLAEEILFGIHAWRTTLSLMDETPPEDDPLIETWNFFLDGTLRGRIQAEIDSLTPAGQFIEAERALMNRRAPLTLLMTIQHGRYADTRTEYLRRQKTFSNEGKKR